MTNDAQDWQDIIGKEQTMPLSQGRNKQDGKQRQFSRGITRLQETQNGNHQGPERKKEKVKEKAKQKGKKKKEKKKKREKKTQPRQRHGFSSPPDQRVGKKPRQAHSSLHHVRKEQAARADQETARIENHSAQLGCRYLFLPTPYVPLLSCFHFFLEAFVLIVPAFPFSIDFSPLTFPLSIPCSIFIPRHYFIPPIDTSPLEPTSPRIPRLLLFTYFTPPRPKFQRKLRPRRPKPAQSAVPPLSLRYYWGFLVVLFRKSIVLAGFSEFFASFISRLVSISISEKNNGIVFNF